MRINEAHYQVRDLDYIIRSAVPSDAAQLSELRPKIDGETENLDREPGEAFIDVPGFERFIQADTDGPRNLFLVAQAHNRIVGFSRCEGVYLQRFAHKVEFGVGVLREFWGHGIGRNLLNQSVAWADANNIRKMTLNVVETNQKAIKLYESCGFKIEGTLVNDRKHADGAYHDTIVMGRWSSTTEGLVREVWQNGLDCGIER